MWDGIVEEEQDLSWLVEGVKNGTMTAVTNGSYKQKGVPDVSGTGWLLCCRSAQRMLWGNLYEVSNSASSYQGELLGLLAIHHLLLSICEFYNIDKTHCKVCCDNIAALQQTEWQQQRIKTSASQADVLRAVWTMKITPALYLLYLHFDAHQDRKKLWWQLTLEEQLNCVCDSLAKVTIIRGMTRRMGRMTIHLLPCEKAAIIVNRYKLTTEMAKEVCYCLG